MEDWEEIRAFVSQAALVESSLRSVADEMDVSHTWVKKFIDGKDPGTKNGQKLLVWYEKRRAAGLSSRATTSSDQMIRMLADVPELNLFAKAVGFRGVVGALWEIARLEDWPEDDEDIADRAKTEIFSGKSIGERKLEKMSELRGELEWEPNS